MSPLVRLPAGFVAALALLIGAAPATVAATTPAAAAAATAAPVAAAATTAATPLLNERHPLEGVASGGAPGSTEGFAALAAAGYRTYVDLRPAAESGPEAEVAAKAAGLDYRRIPIAGEADLDLGSARALAAILDEPARRPLVVACKTGNRAAALLALQAFWLGGSTPEAALALGQRAGLTHLEPTVRTLLGLGAKGVH